MRVGLAQMPDIQRLTKTEIGAQKNPPTEIERRIAVLQGDWREIYYLLFNISQFIIYNYLLINMIDTMIMVSICNVINMLNGLFVM